MSSRGHLHFLQQMPFVRLIIPLIAGIVLQYNFHFPLVSIFIGAGVAVVFYSAFTFLSRKAKYNFRWMPGVSINVALLLLGTLLVYKQDITNNKNWIGKYHEDNTTLLVTVQEQPIEKAKTYKAEAIVNAININGEWQDVVGKVIIYFGKDNIKKIGYGSKILFKKPLQEIKNSGNPGGFDYKQYNAFQDIYHQVFLKTSEYVVTSSVEKSAFKNWLFGVRLWVITKLQQYIQPQREAGVAEALLIGYRNDLDKELVQAYSNTGVVHIIAISGLHLGMIYLALVWLLKPFKKTRWIRFAKPVIILTVLWIFTMLAGGVPSILRSAVMFSFIVFAEALNRKSSIYNTLAVSAFVMLCINPYYLWDVGFQLSYAAVLGIVAFSKPVYHWFYFKNKMLNFLWELASVTISAQVFTVPIIFYIFHQFPTVFLVTNILIVPLSSIVLFAELALLLASFIPAVAAFAGSVTAKMLVFMDAFIERVNSFPYAVYDGIENNLFETFLLYLVIIAVCFWLMTKAKPALQIACVALFVFVTIDSYENYNRRQQQAVIVYNIPQFNAIDFVDSKQFAFVGDSTLARNNYLTNFNLKPARTLYRLSGENKLDELYISKPFVWFNGKRILLLDKPFKFQSASKIMVDAIIISHNAHFNIGDLAAVFECKQFVFDASNSSWKINQWKKDCEKLHLQNYSTPDNGAYILNL